MFRNVKIEKKIFSYVSQTLKVWTKSKFAKVLFFILFIDFSSHSFFYFLELKKQFKILNRILLHSKIKEINELQDCNLRKYL